MFQRTTTVPERVMNLIHELSWSRKTLLQRAQVAHHRKVWYVPFESALSVVPYRPSLVFSEIEGSSLSSGFGRINDWPQSDQLGPSVLDALSPHNRMLAEQDAQENSTALLRTPLPY